MKTCIECKHFFAHGSGPEERGFSPGNVGIGCDLDIWSAWDGSWSVESEPVTWTTRGEDRPDSTDEFRRCLRLGNECLCFESAERESSAT